jgi:malate dehydrogenase (oxaloacetate-decarboxylating)(NADP+)
MDSGVAKNPILDFEAYEIKLKGHLDPTSTALENIYQQVKNNPKRVVFAEGENATVLRAAIAFQQSNLGTPIVIGDPDKLIKIAHENKINKSDFDLLEIFNSVDINNTDQYVDFLYQRLQRRGYMLSDCRTLIRNNVHTLGACLVAHNDADALVTGKTTNTMLALDDVRLALDNVPSRQLMGISLLLAKGKTKIISDTLVNELPDTDALAKIAIQSAEVARRIGVEPTVALLSYSSFGYPNGARTESIRAAVRQLTESGVDFEFDGEMSAEIALNAEARKDYGFTNLKHNANVLVMPGIHSAVIATTMLKELGDATVIGPLLFGLEKSVQMIPMTATSSDILNMAALAAYDLNISKSASHAPIIPVKLAQSA